jgi:hypothetical protein
MHQQTAESSRWRRRSQATSRTSGRPGWRAGLASRLPSSQILSSESPGSLTPWIRSGMPRRATNSLAMSTRLPTRGPAISGSGGSERAGDAAHAESVARSASAWATARYATGWMRVFRT